MNKLKLKIIAWYGGRILKKYASTMTEHQIVYGKTVERTFHPNLITRCVRFLKGLPMDRCLLHPITYKKVL